MHGKCWMGIIAIALVIFLPSGRPWAAEADAYRLITKISVGGEGMWDYASVDSAARRLYLTHGIVS
jgi:hypothetical protein